MNLLTKIFKADLERVTRFHSLKGEFVGFTPLLHLPRYLLNWALSKRGRFRRLPWIPENATKKIESILWRDWTILECGSGMSTIWWSTKVNRVISLETDSKWFEALSRTIASERIQNIQLYFAPDCVSMIQANIKEVNFIVVDGRNRDRCMREILNFVRAPVWIYLDNTDRSPFQPEMMLAEAMLLEIKLKCDFFEYYTGFAPGLMTPSQGLLIHMGNVTL